MKYALPEPALAPLRGPARDEAIAELCDRKQSCLLATPYLAVESRFLESTATELVMRAGLSQESARHTLGSQPFRVRFPWALTYFAGHTRLLGYEQEEQRRVLRLAIPEILAPDEQREAFRLDRVGKSLGAVSTPEGVIVRFTLENVSVSGAAIFATDPLPAEGFQVGRPLTLSLALDRGFTLEAETRIIHSERQSLGLHFENLPGAVIDDLKAWMAPRTEELVRLWENRAEIRARAIKAAQPKAPPSGILVLTLDSDLPGAVAEALEARYAVRTCPAALVPFREAMEQPPLLVMVDASEAGLEERHRIRGLFEAVPPGCPILLLGRSGNADRTQAFANEVKASFHIEWNPAQGMFFRRLVNGLIRRHVPGSAGV